MEASKEGTGVGECNCQDQGSRKQFSNHGSKTSLEKLVQMQLSLKGRANKSLMCQLFLIGGKNKKNDALPNFYPKRHK